MAEAPIASVPCRLSGTEDGALLTASTWARALVPYPLEGCQEVQIPPQPVRTPTTHDGHGALRQRVGAGAVRTGAGVHTAKEG